MNLILGAVVGVLIGTLGGLLTGTLYLMGMHPFSALLSGAICCLILFGWFASELLR